MTHQPPSASRVDDPLADLTALPAVRDAVGEARQAMDALLGHRVLRRRSAEVTAESFLRGAWANAALAGADRPLDEFRNGGADPGDAHGAVVAGALRVAAGFGALTPVFRLAPGQALARLHTLVAADALPADLLGRPRDPASDFPAATGGAIQDPVLAALGPPPPAAWVGPRLAALAELLASGGATPAVVVAAVAHGELLALRPFAWGNGLVARAVERMAIVCRGLDPKAVSAPEVGHAELGLDRYLEAARGYLTGAPEGVAGWVAHCAEAISLGARESVAVCEALLRA